MSTANNNEFALTKDDCMLDPRYVQFTNLFPFFLDCVEGANRFFRCQALSRGKGKATKNIESIFVCDCRVVIKSTSCTEYFLFNISISILLFHVSLLTF